MRYARFNEWMEARDIYLSNNYIDWADLGFTEDEIAEGEKLYENRKKFKKEFVLQCIAENKVPGYAEFRKNLQSDEEYLIGVIFEPGYEDYWRMLYFECLLEYVQELSERQVKGTDMLQKFSDDWDILKD